MTDTMIRWDPLFPVILSVVIALVILALLIILELRRKLKYKTIRVFAQCLLVASVLLITLRPAVPVNTKSASILLITDGYSDVAIDSLKRNDPSLQVVTTPDANPYRDATAMKSLNELAQIGGRVSMIAGNGLPAWAIALMPEKKFVFNSSEASEGISSIDIPDHVYAHRWNEVRGSYDLAGGFATVRLLGPGGVEDSVELKGPGTVPFALSYFAKASGRFNYELVTAVGTEPLPVVIEPERNFSILFIADYPTFEIRYLKNFLASKGHRLAIRNQVSRGKYKLEFANRPAANYQSLTVAVLKEADLLVIDEPSWHALNSAEQKNLRSAAQDGLGVLVLPASKPDKRRSPLIQFTSTDNKDTARVSLGRPGSFVLPALPLEVKQSTPLLTSGPRVISGFRHFGAGKVGYQLLSETYQVGLQGKSEAYSSLWVPLLEKCARSEKEDFKLKVVSPFPFYENQPVEFDILSSGDEPHLMFGQTEVPLAEDAWIDDLWHGKIWLETTTWHDLRIDSLSHWIHLAKKGSWKTLHTNNTRKATALAATQSASAISTEKTYDAALLRIILFSLFILSAGFIWLAPKL
ncbi:MAG TPA: hypothetical protein VK508_17475 [Cyclobacteriaceae bacterium]|nr:hypothetical protein [Cyclobacteriaceae bacterium]